MAAPSKAAFDGLVEQLAAANRRIQELEQNEHSITEIGKANRRLDLLEHQNDSQREEIVTLKSEVDSSTRQLTDANRRIEALEDKNELQRDEIAWLKSEAKSYQQELANKATESEKSKVLQNEADRDEIASLKSDARSYKAELDAKIAQIENLKERRQEESWVREVGSEVRLRWLDHRRMKLGKRQNKAVGDRIKSGDRAAHRGRPLVDAWLYEDGQINDGAIYEDLYGVSWMKIMKWKDIEEVVKLCGFRASLQSNNKLSTEFEDLFKRLLDLIEDYTTAEQLQEAFRHDKPLQRLEHELQDCFDAIVAKGPLFSGYGEGMPSRSRPRSDQPTATRAPPSSSSTQWDNWPH
ncbi:MAG: hypothetical protein MMC33_005563 [Icmadophila ericetorum]|nr:hypothetical protein [Icmadophila ericetorum]